MAEKEVSIVIPTYNERENLEKLIPHIEDVFSSSNIRGEIIVIDDNSPDRTGKYAESMNSRYRNIRVVHRSERGGVGSARRLGFSLASKDIIISMEGDNTHNPDYIPEFVKKINDGADLVIGSRYLKDSKIINWPVRRRVVSKVANFVSRFFAGAKLSDVTNGYRAFTKNLLGRLAIESSGYPYNMEFACEAWSRGFRIVEIPIVFKDREKGVSKLSVWKEFFQFLGISFRFSYTYRPIRVFGSLGALFILAGAFLAINLIIIKLNTGVIGDRLPMIIVSLVLIISGIQIFSLGLIADVLSKLRKEILR